ncbi:translation initiation factor IF-2 [Colletotrichum karsti]|uniref:Translation initiation factor IF-2, mitochondrial n=1 Tax=Colletotrichum karsti TaxID=1095194 RepID=A0A9P6LIG3_9PEZI|nr:translation initiation factor IF-2 [Colletotrichum karsti]KAF9873587.1 translation initiation factor IF-2 [Colletotrichum karsti]
MSGTSTRNFGAKNFELEACPGIFILAERSSAYVCAFCRHPALAQQRDLGRRNYSDTSETPSKGPNFSGGWGSSSGASATGSSAIPRPVGPVVTSGWGKPAFGGVPPIRPSSPAASSPDGQQVNSTANRVPVDDGLLPHERAARRRLAKPAPPPPPPPTEAPKTRKIFTQGLDSSIGQSQRPIRGSFSAPRRGGLEEKSRTENRPVDQPDRTKAGEPGKNDWRHRGFDRTPLPGSEKKLQSKPVPHHRHSVKDGLGKPFAPKVEASKTIDAGKSDTEQPAQWGLLARRANALPPVEEPLPVRKEAIKSSQDALPAIKDDFFSKVQQHVHSRQSNTPDAFPDAFPDPRSAFSEVVKSEVVKSEVVESEVVESEVVESEVVESEVVEVEVTESRQGKNIDESYEIDRNARKRDKGGRRGEDWGSARGSKKSASQKRWEDQNQEWGAKDAQRAAARRQQKAEEKARRRAEAEAAAPQSILLPEFISIANLSVALKMKPHDFLGALVEMGFEDITEESIMTGETASLVAMEFGFEAAVDSGGQRDLKPRPPPEDMSILPPRPPVVTIMGHVDHGKTTLLDFLRKSSVAAQEHGGITQHIGAFMVKMSSGKLITFLDTPGHAAFLTMRQRGANVTDIVVLVVAADDSVMPQTLEALKHARAAKVPIIVAINKVDKEDARPDQVKADLARHGVEIEDFGGDVQVVCVSGKTGQGMDELEENIGALAEVQDMRAETDGMAEAWVLEASVKPYGKSANILVKRGTLRPGDHIVAGTTWARIRMLRNEAGQELDEAPPGTPVEILGWREQLPAAGDAVLQAPDEDRARTAVDYREEMREREASSKQLAEQEQREREVKAAAEAAAAAEAGEEVSEEATAKIVNFGVRGDVVGSVEAVCATISEIGNNEVRSRILWSAAGQVSESDVEHAAASKSVIVNFNSTVAGHIKRMAEEKGVRLIDHSVIYHLADEVKQVMSQNLAPKITQKVTGEAEILQVFSINLKGRSYKNIAGCKVRNGLVTRSNNVRVFRKGEKIYDGKIETLKHGKRDVSEIRKGSECGISFDGFADFQAEDQIQVYEEVIEKRSL